MIILLATAAGLLGGCFAKGYTADEEKSQLSRAMVIAREYQGKYAPDARLKENTFHVYDSMKEGDHKLYLTDWVYGNYLDGGEYNMYVNTNTGEIYSDKGWASIESYGGRLAGDLYGLDDNKMIVDVWGSAELPFRTDDDSFGMITLSNMLSATVTLDEAYIRRVIFGQSYRLTYHIYVSKDVNMDLFRTLDITPLGNNVSISVRQYSDDAFSDIMNHPEKRIVSDKEGVIDEYYSDMEEDTGDNTRTEKSTKSEGAAEEYDGTWYAQDDSGSVLTIDEGKMRFESGDIKDEASFEPKDEDDRIVLVEVSDGDIPFWFYEINYYPDDERIEAYTQPMLDDDGGYKRTIFKRDVYEPGDEKMLELLYGDWEIMDDGEMIQEPGIQRDRLRFSLPKYHTVRFITVGGDKETFNIELTDVFEDAGNTYDRLTLYNRAGSGKYAWDEVRPEQSFQIMIANNLGNDYMMLRELGDERTGFATDGLKYDRSISGTWMMRRPDPNDYDEELAGKTTTPSTVGIEDEIRVRGTAFHAIKWMEFGNSCTLQRVEIIPTTVELIGGGTYDAIEYRLPDDKYAYSAVNYEYKGMENMAHGGYFDPALVYVTTDKDGRIVELSKFNYAINGKYYDTGEMVFPR